MLKLSRRLLVGSLSCSAAAGLACVSVDFDEAVVSSETRSIVGGSETTAYPAVPYLSLSLASGEGAACSGTVIAPRIVLTAAHCLDPEESTVTGGSVYFGSKVVGSDPAYAGEVAISDWTWVSGWSLAYGDIGLIQMEGDAPVEPIPYNTQTLDYGVIGDDLRLVGWGKTNHNSNTSAGTKRTVVAAVTDLDSSVVYYGNGNANTCQGDSGGPGLLNIGGQDRVATVTSYGTGACLGESGSTRVDVFKTWIASWVADKNVNPPPSVNITEPAHGATVRAGFQVFLDASDNTDIERLELWVNGQLHQRVTNVIPPFIFATPALGDGQATIEARAYDNRGDLGSDTVVVQVDSNCNGDEECGGAFVCDAGRCVAPNLDLGSDCTDNGQCASGLCAQAGDRQLCTAECTPSAPECPNGFSCLAASEELGYCWPNSGGGDEDEGGGCAASTGSTASGWTLLLVVLIRLRSRRRRAS